MSTAGRLTPDNVRKVKRRLAAHDADLVRRTGLSLRQIAARAAGADERRVAAAVRALSVAVVRITSGEGVIAGFTEAVQAILAHLGAEAFIAERPDVGGIAEAVERRADTIFMADDDRFIAVSPAIGHVADNAQATAVGYVAALEAMAGSLARRRVLVIGGAGRVGRSAALALAARDAQVAVFDTDRDRARSLAAGRAMAVEDDFESALARHAILFDASPAADIIEARHIAPGTLIAAPGIPLGLTEAARRVAGDRLIHDALELGVAAMLAQAALAHRTQTSTGG